MLAESNLASLAGKATLRILWHDVTTGLRRAL